MGSADMQNKPTLPDNVLYLLWATNNFYNVSKSYLVLILVVAIFIVNINFLRYLNFVEDIFNNKQTSQNTAGDMYLSDV